uniref:Uncharacterized protein n=1 Tax=Oryza brachyantha TaxID=4533 RepID=J3LEI5_ORYBR
MKGICLLELDDENSTTTTPVFGKLKDIVLDNDDDDDCLGEPSSSGSSMNDDGSAEMPARRHGCGNGRLINICFGAQGLTVEDSASGQQTSEMF